MEHKSLGVREERRALFLRVLSWKRKGERSELSVLFLVFAREGNKWERSVSAKSRADQQTSPNGWKWQRAETATPGALPSHERGP